ncbi:MAG: c-type cytochrome [Chitinophagales bacterium]
MKKILLPIIGIGLLIACNSGGSKEKIEPGANDITKNPDYQKGLALVAKSDCFTCHKIDEQLTGPAYRDVANKYAAMPDTIVAYLAKKIIAGGTGTWGAIFMVPHPQVAEEDAKQMVKYILLLKK